LVEDLQAAGVRARTFADVDTIAVAIARNVRPGDVVVLLSNGDFGGLRGKLVDLWQEHAPQQG
jgi:UDP-N-acetylmuramate: L-alanyl-gamma-D-glutamyl-meso-diaminopimelate ligase